MATAKEMLDKVAQIRNKSSDSTILDKSKGTFTATAIGAGLGLLIGYNRKYNLLISAFVGGAVAGILSNYFIKKAK